VTYNVFGTLSHTQSVSSSCSSTITGSNISFCCSWSITTTTANNNNYYY